MKQVNKLREGHYLLASQPPLKFGHLHCYPGIELTFYIVQTLEISMCPIPIEQQGTTKSQKAYDEAKSCGKK